MITLTHGQQSQRSHAGQSGRFYPRRRRIRLPARAEPTAVHISRGNRAKRGGGTTGMPNHRKQDCVLQSGRSRFRSRRQNKAAPSRMSTREDDARFPGKSAWPGIREGAPETTRTSDTRFRKPLLYPLSYRGWPHESTGNDPRHREVPTHGARPGLHARMRGLTRRNAGAARSVTPGSAKMCGKPARGPERSPR